MTKEEARLIGEMAADIKSIMGDVGEIKASLALQNHRLRTVETKQAAMEGGISVAKWLAGLAGLPGIAAVLQHLAK